MRVVSEMPSARCPVRREPDRGCCHCRLDLCLTLGGEWTVCSQKARAGQRGGPRKRGTSCSSALPLGPLKQGSKNTQTATSRLLQTISSQSLVEVAPLQCLICSTFQCHAGVYQPVTSLACSCPDVLFFPYQCPCPHLHYEPSAASSP